MAGSSSALDDEVRGTNGRTAIPHGSTVELTVRAARGGDRILELEPVNVNGKRYALEAERDIASNRAAQERTRENWRSRRRR